MAKKTYYKQCKVIKKVGDGHLNQVTWLPEQYAIKGKVLKLRGDDDVWEDGWVVESAGTNRVEEPPYAEGMIRGHRKATGDSLPKSK